MVKLQPTSMHFQLADAQPACRDGGYCVETDMETEAGALSVTGCSFATASLPRIKAGHSAERDRKGRKPHFSIDKIQV